LLSVAIHGDGVAMGRFAMRQGFGNRQWQEHRLQLNRENN